MIRMRLVFMTKIVLVFSIFILFLSCSKDVPVVRAEPFIRQVSIYKTQISRESREISSYGSISFSSKADVSAVLEAKVVNVNVKEGLSVESGEELLRLSNAQLEIRKKQAETAVASAQAALSLAEARYGEGRLRIKAGLISLEKEQIALDWQKGEVEELYGLYMDKLELFQAGGITEKALESAETQYNRASAELLIKQKDIEIQSLGLGDEYLLENGYPVPQNHLERESLIIRINTKTLAAEIEAASANLLSAKAEMDAVELLMRDLIVVCPVPGIIASIYCERGEFVKPGDNLVSVFCCDKVYAVFNVNEKDISLVKQGMSVSVSADALVNKTFIGDVEVISPIVDSQSGSFMVKANIDNPANLLKPGMFVRVCFKAGPPKERLKVPSECLSNKNIDTAKVYVVRDDKAFARIINLGGQGAGFTEVLSGLSEGEIIIKSPSPALMDGENVQTID